MYCAILLFNQSRHIVSESHYLRKKEGLGGLKNFHSWTAKYKWSPPWRPEALHKYGQGDR